MTAERKTNRHERRHIREEDGESISEQTGSLKVSADQTKPTCPLIRNLMVVTQLSELIECVLQQAPVLLWRSGVSRMKYSLITASSKQFHPSIVL